ncbi:hypothetical protein MPER_09804 [Moniliophthora perniciosa FA553]|nr:hypothetical protein MPER_09804 [Moniliophthora perniciosa FA553]
MPMAGAPMISNHTTRLLLQPHMTPVIVPLHRRQPTPIVTHAPETIGTLKLQDYQQRHRPATTTLIPSLAIQAEIEFISAQSTSLDKPSPVRTNKQQLTNSELLHNSSPVLHRCRYCRKEFSRADSLKRHLDNGCDEMPSSK